MIAIFYRFLLLGLISFGGPIAHIGYFQKECVGKQKWLTQEKFNEALALCQFLPGPASSQLGMYIGYQKGGYLGALLAFIGFTLPSFTLLTFAAIYTHQLSDNTFFSAFIYAAKLLAVVVVFDAINSMFRKFILDKTTFFVCALAAGVILLFTGLWTQLFVILMAASIGILAAKVKSKISLQITPEIKTPSLKKTSLFLGTFFIFFLLPSFFDFKLAIIFNYFYQAGSLVFGGGHVVLPLLEPLLNQEINKNVLVEGYAAAQLIPGPMFTIASYIGASFTGINPFLGSIVATLAIFLPGALLLFAALPFWTKVLNHPSLSGAIRFINAAVVGLLIAAFFDPIWVSAIYHYTDIVLVLAGAVLIRFYNLSPFKLILPFFVYAYFLHY
jgi:chromate transporter